MNKLLHVIFRFFIVTLIIPFLSCQKIFPAGFWTNYRIQNLVENNSNQGPFGGRRSLYWHSDIDKTFRSDQLIAFALKNGWEVHDSLNISRDALKSWESEGPKFPFSYKDFIINDSRNLVFPRWITTDSKLYRFTTGWVALEPGTNIETNKNGYILISSNGKDLSIYHLWGE